MTVMSNFRALKLVGMLAVALSIGACAKNPTDNANLANASAAVPGSQQDFVVNVGDRVFFESDSS
jgi:peptidoglycan-associated lipoprotein